MHFIWILLKYSTFNIKILIPRVFLSKFWYMCDVLIERRGLIIWPWVYLLHNDVRAYWHGGLIILHWRIIHSGPCKSVQDSYIFLWRFSVFSKDKVWIYLYDFRIYTASYQWWVNPQVFVICILFVQNWTVYQHLHACFKSDAL